MKRSLVGNVVDDVAVVVVAADADTIVANITVVADVVANIVVDDDVAAIVVVAADANVVAVDANVVAVIKKCDMS